MSSMMLLINLYDSICLIMSCSKINHFRWLNRHFLCYANIYLQIFFFNNPYELSFNSSYFKQMSGMAFGLLEGLQLLLLESHSSSICTLVKIPWSMFFFRQKNIKIKVKLSIFMIPLQSYQICDLIYYYSRVEIHHLLFAQIFCFLIFFIYITSYIIQNLRLLLAYRMIKNYYDILEIKRDASGAQIAQKFKRLSLRGDNIHQISQAYEVLSDPLKKAFYDKYGYEKLKEGLFSQGQLKGGYRYSNNPNEIFEKYFHEHSPLSQSVDMEILQKGSLFGHAYGGLKYKQSHKLQNLVVDVPCSLNELYIGVSKRVNYQRRVLNLDGRTTSVNNESKNIQIEAGFKAKKEISFRNEGHESIHRQTSDLIFRIVEIKDNNYSRQGSDLIYSLDISLADALNCQSIQVKTLDNRLLLVPIDEIISPSAIKEVVGEGMPGEKGKKGNLYVKFNIVFPESLSEQIKQELRSLLA